MIVYVISRVGGILETGVLKAEDFLTSLILPSSKRILSWYKNILL